MVQLANENQSEVIRQQAGLYIKVQLSAEEETIRAHKLQQWDMLDDTIKTQIKAGTLQVRAHDKLAAVFTVAVLLTWAGRCYRRRQSGATPSSKRSLVVVLPGTGLKIEVTPRGLFEYGACPGLM